LLASPPIQKNRGLDLEIPSQRFHLLDAKLSLAGEDLRDRRIGESRSGSDLALRFLVGLDQVAQHVDAGNRRDRVVLFLKHFDKYGECQQIL
jgi:hypothetical protein